jgi:hypothetical protein
MTVYLPIYAHQYTDCGRDISCIISLSKNLIRVFTFMHADGIIRFSRIVLDTYLFSAFHLTIVSMI